MTVGRRYGILITAFAALPLLAGCASRAGRIESALVQAGVPGGMAACLAPKLADRLSDDQLRALAAATKRAPGDTAKLGRRAIVARVAGIGDPQIIDVVTGAGLHCALNG